MWLRSLCNAGIERSVFWSLQLSHRGLTTGKKWGNKGASKSKGLSLCTEARLVAGTAKPALKNIVVGQPWILVARLAIIIAIAVRSTHKHSKNNK